MNRYYRKLGDFGSYFYDRKLEIKVTLPMVLNKLNDLDFHEETKCVPTTIKELRAENERLLDKLIHTEGVVKAMDNCTAPVHCKLCKGFASQYLWEQENE